MQAVKDRGVKIILQYTHTKTDTKIHRVHQLPIDCIAGEVDTHTKEGNYAKNSLLILHYSLLYYHYHQYYYKSIQVNIIELYIPRSLRVEYQMRLA